MARASYQNLSRISLGSRSKAPKVKPKKNKQSRQTASKVDHPTIVPVVVSVSVDRTHKPILKLKY